MFTSVNAICEEYGNVIFLLECHRDNLNGIRFYEKNGFVNTHILNKKGTDFYMISALHTSVIDKQAP